MFQKITHANFSVIGLVIVLIGMASWLISIVLYYLKYWGFKIVKSGEEYVLSYGLLHKHSLTFHPSRIQAVQMVEGVL